LPPKEANTNVLARNTVANTAVLRDKKLALPLAPNKLAEPEPPLPNAAPASAPLPCCTKINPIIAMADTICRVKTTVIKIFTKTPFY
jgi:hypothetical protein